MDKSGAFIVRPIAATDQEILWEMLYQAIYVAPDSPLLPREIVHEPALARYVQNWPQPGDLGWMALEAQSGQAVGAAWLRLFPVSQPGYGYIDSVTPELSIAVLPGFRGQGIGTGLLSQLLQAAQEKYPAVSLSVSAGNPAAALYQRLGFDIHHADGDSLVMRKDWAPLWAEILHRPGLNTGGLAIRREAVRAIIQNGTRLLMIYSSKNGDYKFPGGGVQSGETHGEALKRELLEECGASLSQMSACAGKVVEYDAPIESQVDVFKMTSYYYRCQIDGELGRLDLDDYERDLGFTPVWVGMDTATQINAALIDDPQRPAPRWTKRDLLVLERIV